MCLIIYLEFRRPWRNDLRPLYIIKNYPNIKWYYQRKYWNMHRIFANSVETERKGLADSPNYFPCISRHQVRTICFLLISPFISAAVFINTVYPKKYAHGFCFAVLCCGYTLTDFPISIRLTSLALWQSNDCPSASKATLMNMDKYFMWIHYERLHNHNKANHKKKTCAYFLGYTVATLHRKAVS